MIDIHAHLNFPDCQKDLELIVKRALKSGVKKIICVSSNLKESRKAIKIARQYPQTVLAAVGIHPHQTDPENRISLKEQVKELGKLALKKEVAAIAECGLDYSPAPPGEKERTKKDQYFLFENQLQLAQKLNLPVQIHSRKAFQDTLSTIQNYRCLKGVWHCYSEGKKGIEPISNLGFYFGVDGNLTYDQGLQNVFKLIPLKRILLETDSPFLTPEPHRGKRNEPAYLAYTAKALAKIKKATFEKIDKITTQNTLTLLGKSEALC